MPSTLVHVAVAGLLLGVFGLVTAATVRRMATCAVGTDTGESSSGSGASPISPDRNEGCVENAKRYMLHMVFAVVSFGGDKR